MYFRDIFRTGCFLGLELVYLVIFIKTRDLLRFDGILEDRSTRTHLLNLKKKNDCSSRRLC